jgi:hypothetical protein
MKVDESDDWSRSIHRASVVRPGSWRSRIFPCCARRVSAGCSLFFVLAFAADNAPSDAEARRDDQIEAAAVLVRPHGPDFVPDGFLVAAFFRINHDICGMCRLVAHGSPLIVRDGENTTQKEDWQAEILVLALSCFSGRSASGWPYGHQV